jgi:LmbE family N-acetylglucosaminyl deacetylase
VIDSFPEIFSGKSRLLVVLAHPDDAEINAGGTIARCLETRIKVRLVVTTDGGKGTKDKILKPLEFADFARKRKKEQMEGGRELGIELEENFNLDIPDGELEETVENIGQVVYHIRQFKPDLIITHNPEQTLIRTSAGSGWVNHRDHLITGKLVCFAAYPYARDTGFFPEQLQQGLQPHAVKEMLFVDNFGHPDEIGIDVEKYLEPKRKALAKHITAFSPEDVEDYIGETKRDGGYFEVFRRMKNY